MREENGSNSVLNKFFHRCLIDDSQVDKMLKDYFLS